MQGADLAIAQSLSQGDIDGSALEDREKQLLELCKQVTLHAHQTTADQIQALRDVGWSETEIAEAIYITALFAMFNRVADAFGLQDPGYDQMENPPRPAERSRPD